MAAVQTAQSRAALSLFVVLVIAKVMMLAGRQVELTAWLPLAYFWQDVLVALMLGVCGRLVRRPVLTWACYALVAAYVALNVPIALELSTPLSTTMWRAARGPLSDSVAAGFTWRNVGAMSAIVFVALAAPLITRRVRDWTTGRAAIAAALAWIVAGAAVSAHIDTRGLHRNAIGALMPAAVPVAASASSAVDWRAPVSPAETKAEDLRSHRGAASGMNVVMIPLESTAARYLGLYGAAVDPMPNLSRLARHATVFD